MPVIALMAGVASRYSVWTARDGSGAVLVSAFASVALIAAAAFVARLAARRRRGD